jgi:2-dehydro-3-deoxyphosphogluconate aldolase/(4S)-4-hydroxy-2-oxoglutarate aldolase
MDEILERLGELGVIPVVSIPRAEDADALGRALLDGGLPCAEITFRTQAAQSALQELASAYPGVLLGAGTVLSVAQAEMAVRAGARFIVSPGFDGKVVGWCLDHGVAVTPGVATPTEIQMALERGLRVLKFFPAGTLGGPSALKAIAAPFVGVKFIPTGGVDIGNLADYLRIPSVHACGGSWLAPSDLMAAGRFEEITRRVRDARELVQQVRLEGVKSR